MRKYRFLLLGLQLGIPIAIDTYNSWYLYSLECYRTSCSSCNEHPILNTISYIRCNSHATICNFFAINLHIRFPHTFQHGERNANVASSICQWMLCVNIFCNIYNYFIISLTNIIFDYFIHPFDEWILFLYLITYLQLFYN
jgi:hypothetical protein